jgi:trehalose 2-sulfotransferase
MPVKSTDDESRRTKQEEGAPISHYADRRLDFPGPIALRKSYIVASAQRCGSTFLCNLLWQTGVLGAPAAYFQYRKRPTAKTLRDMMMERLKASSPDDYLAKLLACRTSTNGIFGVKVHFHDFEAMLRQTAGILDLLSPVTFIYVDRTDKLAQAVSLAMALQTDAWTSLKKSAARAVRYDRDLIAKCLEQNEQQELSWRKWFEDNDVEPWRVTYEDLTAGSAAVVRRTVELLDAQDDEPDAILVPKIEKQGDETNSEWIARFRQETESDAEGRERAAGEEHDRAAAAADGGLSDSGQEEHIFQRFDRFIKKTPAGQRAVTGVVDSIRMRFRYEAIIAANRDLFRSARVLDIQSFDGRWSLAALEAGAIHVVGVDMRPRAIEAAERAFAEFGIEPQSYQFVNAKILAALNTFSSEEFDVILCRDSMGQSDPRLFFQHLQRLRPRHVVLDAAIARGNVPMATFKLENQGPGDAGAARRLGSIVAVPNHELIALLCDCFGFRWRQIDWHALGVTDWTGLHDYERDLRRTYVLDLVDGADGPSPPPT